jgi:choice-of-anchor B domain-containing protein
MMKKFTLTCLAMAALVASFAQTPCEDGMAGDWPCENIDLWAFMTLDDIGGGANTNDVWGWTDETSGREFALIGKDNGTAFIEVTDPGDPIYLGTLDTETTASLWRDIKVFDNRAYIVSEAGDHGMQIFDLTLLLDVVDPPTTFSSMTVYNGFGSAHNIVINEESGFAYGVGTSTVSGGLHIVDIDVPNPVDAFIAGTFEEDGYTHDAHVVNYIGPDQDFGGKEIAFCCNNDAVTIVDVTNKSDCEMISTISYTNTGYTHQGWLSQDHKYFLFNDELDEMNFDQNTRTHVLDVQDLANPEYIGFWEYETTSIDHNMYVIGDLCYASNYRSGLRILDVAQVADVNFKSLAYFDVTPSNDDPQFSGSWSNYAWFKSGTVVCSDMYDGFFILKPTVFVVDPESAEVECGDDSQTFTVNVNAEIDGTFIVSQEGLPETVQVVTSSFEAPGEATVTFNNLSSLATGEYEFQFLFMTEFGTYPVWSSITVVGETPATPTLESPVDLSDLDNTQPTFEWEEIAGAEDYHFELSEFDDFNTTLVAEVVTDNSFPMPFDLLPGTYYWRVWATNDCGDSEISDVFSFTILDTGIDGAAKPAVMVYPNPASDIITVSIQGASATMQITDVTGRSVLESVLNTPLTTIDIGDWAVGMYTIRINNEPASLFEKR